MALTRSTRRGIWEANLPPSNHVSPVPGGRPRFFRRRPRTGTPSYIHRAVRPTCRKCLTFPLLQSASSRPGPQSRRFHPGRQHGPNILLVKPCFEAIVETANSRKRSSPSAVADPDIALAILEYTYDESPESPSVPQTHPSDPREGARAPARRSDPQAALAIPEQSEWTHCAMRPAMRIGLNLFSDHLLESSASADQKCAIVAFHQASRWRAPASS